ncbi:MAG: hypothetical protein R2708_17440 [Vicinamibacterales bacterium]
MTASRRRGLAAGAVMLAVGATTAYTQQQPLLLSAPKKAFSAARSRRDFAIGHR